MPVVFLRAKGATVLGTRDAFALPRAGTYIGSSHAPEHYRGRGEGAWERACSVLARLWVEGEKVDWRALTAAHAQKKVSLPTYPFERKRYWIEETKGKGTKDVSLKTSFVGERTKEGGQIVFRASYAVAN